MRIKKLMYIIIVLTLVLSLGITMVGCSNDKEEGVNVLDAYMIVIDRIFKSNIVDVSKGFYGSVISDLAVTNKLDPSKDLSLSLNISGNMDISMNGKNETNKGYVELINTSGGRSDKVIGLYADGESLFVDLINKHYQIENFKIYDMLKGANQSDWSGVGGILAVLAGIFFTSADIEGNDYTFHYDIKKLFDTMDDTINQTFTTEELNEFAAQLNYKDWATLKGDLSAINGTVKYTFDSKDKFTGKTWHNNSKNMTFKMGVSEFDFNNGTIDFDINNHIPKDIDWIMTKLMNFTIKGNLTLNCDDNKLAKYSWELRTNLDPLELIANGGDFNLDEDDMAHFILRNNTADNSKEFNDSRINAKSGVIAELAYSPQEFKTKNVLATVNLKALLPKSIFTEFGLPPGTSAMIPEYYGLHFDNDIIGELLAGFEDGKGKMLTNLSKNLIRTMKNGGSCKIDSTKGDDAQNKMLGMITKSGKKNINKIDFKVESFVFADQANKEYKPSEHFLNTSNEENEEPKDFGKANGYYPAKESKAVEKDGFIEITTADGKIINKENKLKVEEVKSLIGATVSYTYTDYYGEERVATIPVQIIGYSGLDEKELDVPQSINLITSPPDGKNLGSFLISLGVIPPIPLNVYTTNIILTK